MHAKLRIGQVSQQVIDSAHYAEAINTAGRLRMPSQRIVKSTRWRRPASGGRLARLLADSVTQVDQSLSVLAAQPVAADLRRSLGAVQGTLGDSAGRAGRSAGDRASAVLDQEAERLLELSDRLDPGAGECRLTPSLHVIMSRGASACWRSV